MTNELRALIKVKLLKKCSVHYIADMYGVTEEEVLEVKKGIKKVYTPPREGKDYSKTHQRIAMDKAKRELKQEQEIARILAIK